MEIRVVVMMSETMIKMTMDVVLEMLTLAVGTIYNATADNVRDVIRVGVWNGIVSFTFPSYLTQGKGDDVFVSWMDHQQHF